MSRSISEASGPRSRCLASALHIISVCALALLLQLPVNVALAVESLDDFITLDIPENTSLEDALIEWGLRSRMTVMMSTRSAKGIVTHKISGRFRARQALMLLLGNSGLSYRQDGSRVQIIPALNTSLNFQGGATGRSPVLSDPDSLQSKVNGETLTRNGSISRGPQDSTGESSLSEVVVRTQNRKERLQGVPESVIATLRYT